MTSMSKSLHWSQRVCLIRHNLHVASRTGDFGFFKALQAQEFVNGIDHVASLRETLGDYAESVLSNLDNLNAVIAYVHEDAFRNVYDNIKASISDRRGSNDDRRSNVHTDVVRERQVAESSIDKMLNSAVELIQSQPARSQEEAASVLIMGTTFIADAMEVCLCQMIHLENSVGDFIGQEDSWVMVQCAVGSAVTAMKGVFSLMTAGSAGVEEMRCPLQRTTRSQSIDTFARNMMRRMSTSMSSTTASVPSSPASRRTSITPASLPMRSSVSAAYPATTQPKRPLSSGTFGLMSTIPATPGSPLDSMIDPFDNSRIFDITDSPLASPNGITRTRAPSSIIAPHELPSTMPMLDARDIKSQISSSSMQDNTDLESGILFDSPSPLSPAPDNGTIHAISSTDFAPEFPVEAVVKRRRSVNVHGTAPDMKGLYGSASGSGSAVTLNGEESCAARDQEQRREQAPRRSLMDKLSSAFAMGNGSSISLSGALGGAVSSSASVDGAAAERGVAV